MHWKVAYKLESSPTFKTFPVFHVSRLKPYKGDNPRTSDPVPPHSMDNQTPHIADGNKTENNFLFHQTSSAGFGSIARFYQDSMWEEVE